MKNLIEKLVLIQSELKAPKGQRNNFGNYNYRSCEDILEAVKPHLKKHGLYLSITDEVVNIGDRYYIKATSIITDGVDRWSIDAFAREEESKKGMDASQISGACGSYARKYSLNGMFAIDDNKDSDATNQYDKASTIIPQAPALKTNENVKGSTTITPFPTLKTNGGEAVQMANLLKVAIAETGMATDSARLKQIWEAYPMFHLDATFKATLNAKKLEINK